MFPLRSLSNNRLEALPEAFARIRVGGVINLDHNCLQPWGFFSRLPKDAAGFRTEGNSKLSQTTVGRLSRYKESRNGDRQGMHVSADAETSAEAEVPTQPISAISGPIKTPPPAWLTSGSARGARSKLDLGTDLEDVMSLLH